MFKYLFAIVGTAFAMSSSAHAAPLSFSQWEAQEGDMFVVDTENNMGYLIHPDGSYMADVVGTGQKGFVNYGKFGRIWAETPHGLWRILSDTIQSDRGTFGPTGMFLRLHKNGEETGSPYGIHDVANNDKLLASVDRYWSMGCILVRADLLDLLEKEYALHNDKGGFLVVTVGGFDVEQPRSTLAKAD